MIWSIQQVYHGPQGRHILAIGFFWKSVSVDLVARAAVEVGDFQNEIDGFEQYIGQTNDAKVLNLTVDKLDRLAAVSLNTETVWNKGVVCDSVSLEVSSCQQTKVVDETALDRFVVPTLKQEYVCDCRVAHVGSQISQQSNGFVFPILKIGVAADINEHVSKAHETRHLTLNLVLVSCFNKFFKI